MVNSAKFDKLHNRLRRFGKDEDGGILIATLLLLIVMLIMGGMAVDFMRFESRRAQLQSVSDRAVLAAAELDQTIDADQVVVDFFEKAGFDDNIIGTPEVRPTPGSRAVEVEAELELNTFFLKLAGINTLRAPAASAAREGAGGIEISLVLDISGSMNGWVDVPGRGWVRKYVLLQEAAVSFIDSMLVPEYEDQISISLVAYSEHVSIGDAMFDRLSINPPLNREAGEDLPLSRCIDFLPSEFGTTALNTSRLFDQVEYFDWATAPSYPWEYYTSCPRFAYQGIVPLSQDRDLLVNTINQYRPWTNTAIHLGMKWGAALLDPSMRTFLATVPGVDAVFAGNRPADFQQDDESLDTTKYVILMTDGENVPSVRIQPQYYDTAAERDLMETYNFNYWNENIAAQPTPLETYTYEGYTAAQANAWLRETCDAAKAPERDIIVHAIAMGATESGETEMRYCASSEDHYHQTEGAALQSIFDQIADQIVDLRLSL